MTILVARPSPSGEALVEQLRHSGLRAIHVPLIQFKPGRDLEKLPGLIANTLPGTLVLLLSQRVLEYLAPVMLAQKTDWPEHLTYFAIGKTTALRFCHLSNLSAQYPQGREISETLLELPQLHSLQNKTILILRGNGGRELLAQTLSQRGADVRLYECYQRCALQYDGTILCADWIRNGINTLVITSGEMLKQLYELVPVHYHDWLMDCRLVVVSERLAVRARELGWKSIQVADNADNNSLMRALKK